MKKILVLGCIFAFKTTCAAQVVSNPTKLEKKIHHQHKLGFAFGGLLKRKLFNVWNFEALTSFESYMINSFVVYTYKANLKNKFSVGLYLNAGLMFTPRINHYFRELCPNGIFAFTVGVNWKKFALDFVIGAGLGILLTFNNHGKFNFSIFIGYPIVELMILCDKLNLNMQFVFVWKVCAKNKIA